MLIVKFTNSQFSYWSEYVSEMELDVIEQNFSISIVMWLKLFSSVTQRAQQAA